ncbi:MAG: hypothetical protein AABZ30_01775 [Myxococcota bacterium]
MSHAYGHSVVQLAAPSPPEASPLPSTQHRLVVQSSGPSQPAAMPVSHAPSAVQDEVDVSMLTQQISPPEHSTPSPQKTT